MMKAREVREVRDLPLHLFDTSLFTPSLKNPPLIFRSGARAYAYGEKYKKGAMKNHEPHEPHELKSNQKRTHEKT
jgi:hypothetical protein